MQNLLAARLPLRSVGNLIKGFTGFYVGLYLKAFKSERFTIYEVVLMDLHLAGPGDVNQQLDTLYHELESWCQVQRIPLHMDALTRSLLSFAKDADYPCGLLGWNNHTFCTLDFAIFICNTG